MTKCRCFRGSAIGSIVVISILASFAGTAYALPGQSLCAVATLFPYERAPNGLRHEKRTAPARVDAVSADLKGAVDRITILYGKPRAKPLIIYLSGSDAVWPLRMNRFGSTSFLPGRTCIFIGPLGENVDVIAHELLHAEVADRVGFWRREFRLPTWFDEGLGMQVDYRSSFRTERAVDVSAVTSLDTPRAFFQVSDDRLRLNYQGSRVVVGHWLNAIGPKALYDRLDDLGEGVEFEEVWTYEP